MLLSRQEVRRFINRFLTEEEDNKISSLGFIEYHNFNKTDITKEHDNIVGFFTERFNLSSKPINYSTLLYDKNKEKWLSIDSYDDIALLDLLIAFGISTGVFEENLIYRFEILHSLGEDGYILNEDFYDLQKIDEAAYMQLMREKVIPFSYLDVSNEVLTMSYDFLTKEDYTDEEKKNMLLSWWDRGMSNHTDEEKTREVFAELLDSLYFKQLVLMVFNLHHSGKTSESLSQIIKEGEVISRLRYFGTIYALMNKNSQSEIDVDLRHMFDEFSQADQKKGALNQKKKRLE